MNPTVALDIIESSEIYVSFEDNTVFVDGRMTLQEVEALVVLARERLQ